MFLKEIEPFVRQALTVTLTPNIHEDTFCNLKTPDCRLFFITSGTGSIEVNRDCFKLFPGCCVLFQSGTQYCWQPEGKSGLTFISVNFDYTQNFSHITQTFHPSHSCDLSDDGIFESVLFDDAKVLNTPFVIYNTKSLNDRFRILTTEYYIGSSYCRELLSAVLKSVIISIVRISSSNNNKGGNKSIELVREIIYYIQRHYSENLSNEAIAEIFHFNSTYINRIFKKNTGTPMHSFLVSYRINMAMELLRSSSTSISDISLMSGFSDIAHFSKYFKQQIGLSPSEYRLNNRGNNLT